MNPMLAVMGVSYVLVLVLATISLAEIVISERTVSAKTAGLGAVLAIGYLPVAALIYAWLVLWPAATPGT